MKISDVIVMSIRQVVRLRRRYRSALIGTAIGTAGLVTLMTIGDSVEDNLGRNLEILGSATTVKATIDYAQYRPQDVEDVKKLPGVMEVAPAVFSVAEKVSCFDKEKVGVRLAGVEPGMFRAVYLPLEEGRALIAEDVDQARNVCVIGREVRKALFGLRDPALGNVVVLASMGFEVVGVLGQADDTEFQETILLPISVARAKIPGMFDVRKMYILPKNWYTVADVHKRVAALLRGNEPRYAHEVTFERERVTIMKNISFTFKMFLYVAIGVTLILGGVGVTNVMLALVKERTTEIGLRKAVGATDGAVILQFLCESLAVSLISVALGIVSGATLSHIITGKILHTVFAHNAFWLSVIGSILIGLVLGVLSGVIPARAAGRLDPVEAMRFE